MLQVSNLVQKFAYHLLENLRIAIVAVFSCLYNVYLIAEVSVLPVAGIGEIAAAVDGHPVASELSLN